MRSGILFCVTLAATGACNPLSLEDDTIKSPAGTYEQHEESVHSECFQVKMEKWFVLFNQFQDEGATMHDADEKAWALADIASRNCLKSRLRGAHHDLKTARK